MPSPQPTFYTPYFPANQAICVKTALAYIVNSRCTENGTFDVQHGHSSIAQLAEHSTVNRRVTGSSPVGGATNMQVKTINILPYAWRGIHVVQEL